jgi:glycosyltransferase involved in cell wall biosynthesis
MTDFISIVLPVHNEFLNLRHLIEEWDTKLKKISKIKHEFVIVEDGSTDGTKDLIIKLEKTFAIINLSSEKKRGYSQAVLDGIKASNGTYILCTDSDNQIKVNSLIENINNLPTGEVFLFGARTPRNDPIHRKIYSKMFKILHDLLFNSNLSDPSCPFVLGQKETFKKLPEEFLLKMREGFWWGFVAVSKKKKINFNEVKIQHFKRSEGDAGYKLSQMPGIIIRNTIGLFIIKLSNF